MKLKTKCYYCGKDIIILIPRKDKKTLNPQFVGYSCNDCIDEDNFMRDGINESIYTEIKKHRCKNLLYVNYPVEVHIDMDFYNGDHTAVCITTPIFDHDLKDIFKQMVTCHLFRNGILTNRSSIRNKKINKRNCYHHYIPMANSHGDIINHINGRTFVVCVKCGKGLWIDDYFEAPYGYSYNGLNRKNNIESKDERVIYEITKKKGKRL